MGMLNGLIDTQAALTRAFLRRKDAEGNQEVSEYLSERLKDFKEDVLVESKHFTVLKYQCGYINHLLPRETERYFERLSQKTSKMISDVCYGKLGNLSKSTNVYTELVIS
jgi:hypothetical protein